MNLEYLEKMNQKILNRNSIGWGKANTLQIEKSKT